MDEYASTIISLVNEHERFLLTTRPQAQHYIVLAREALRFALEKKGAHALSLPELTPVQKNEWSAFLPLSTSTIPAKIIISLPKEKLGEISYEENEDTMSFVITPKMPIHAREIITKEQLPEVEAAFFFFPYEDSYRNEVLKQVRLPAKEKIVFLLENEKTVAEKIYTITREVPFGEDKASWATLLYTSLVFETDNFRSKITPRIFHLAENLVSDGAETGALSTIEEKTNTGAKTLSYAQILGRALARTQVDEATNSSWTFLTQKDFQKSGIQTDKKETAVKDVLAYIERIVPRVETSFLLWEGSSYVSCIIKSKDKKFITQCENAESFSCNGILCRAENFATFTHAELKIRELLKEAKYDTIM